MAPHRQLLPALTHNDGTDVSKRRKRKSQRVRVTRACDRCKKRKIKCNGTQPCEFCLRAEAQCTFDCAYARGRAPVIPSASETNNGKITSPAEDVMSSSESPAGLGQQVSAVSPTEIAQQLATHGIDDISSDGLVPLESTRAAASPQFSPEPSQEDSQGHYIGPASGLSFLLRVQKRLHQAVSSSLSSSIFTFGDAPLTSPDFDPSFCMMPPQDYTQRLVDRYFDFAMPTYRFLHQPTIQEWFEEFYDTLGSMRDITSAPGKVALLFMIFAHARVYMPENDRPGPVDLSTRYYLAAEHQLSKESGSIRLSSIQARLLQCYYLLTQSRVNHCWSQFGIVTNLALAIGLNRNRLPGVRRGLNYIEVESRRRTFWCAYTLDAYLSVSLGRPRSFHDEDIDTELPACVEDSDITRDDINTSALNRGYSIMLAPLAHMKLAQIICKILRALYSIQPSSARLRADATRQLSKALSEWRADLSRFLDASFFSTSLLKPIFQRQRNVLNLTYWHAIILTHRQSVLNNFVQMSQQDRASGRDGIQIEEDVQQCLTAAMNTVNAIDEITQSQQMFRAFWITGYFAFTAAMVLYIYVIQNRASSPDTYADYLHAATQCQSHMSIIAKKGSLFERYCLILEELRVEALRQTGPTHTSSTNFEGTRHNLQDIAIQSTALPLAVSPSDGTSYTDLLGDAAFDFNGMPSSLLGDYSGWDQFASMVSTGLGNFDAFLNDDTFRL